MNGLLRMLLSIMERKRVIVIKFSRGIPVTSFVNVKENFLPRKNQSANDARRTFIIWSTVSWKSFLGKSTSIIRFKTKIAFCSLLFHSAVNRPLFLPFLAFLAFLPFPTATLRSSRTNSRINRDPRWSCLVLETNRRSE